MKAAAFPFHTKSSRKACEPSRVSGETAASIQEFIAPNSCSDVRGQGYIKATAVRYSSFKKIEREHGDVYCMKLDSILIPTTNLSMPHQHPKL